MEMALQSEKSNKRVKTVSLLDGSAYLRRTLNREKTNIEPEVTALTEFVEQFSNEEIPNVSIYNFFLMNAILFYTHSNLF